MKPPPEIGLHVPPFSQGFEAHGFAISFYLFIYLFEKERKIKKN